MIPQIHQLTLDELLRLPQSTDSLAIDLAFPEKFSDELSRMEAFNKHLFRPNTYLHKWWARQFGSEPMSQTQMVMERKDDI